MRRGTARVVHDARGARGVMSSHAQSAVARAQALTDLVAADANKSNAQRHLSADIASAFARDGLFRIAMPADIGGEGADPLTQIETIETIARADGSAGWNLMIGIETFGLLAPGMYDCMDLIADPNVVLCSSTANAGKAERVDGGYRVSGRWQFVSGCHNAQVFGATVQIWENDAPVNKRRYYAMIPLPDFEILDTWHVGGMRGSGSHDVRVSGALVPDARIVAPIGAVTSDDPLLRYPTGARLAYNKVAVATGIAQSALDELYALAKRKPARLSRQPFVQRSDLHRTIAIAETDLAASRGRVLTLTDEIWQAVVRRESVSPRQQALHQAACSRAVQVACEQVDRLCNAAGTDANTADSPLERAARDVRVVRQHLTVAEHHITDAGRVLLGLEAQETMLADLLQRDR